MCLELIEVIYLPVIAVLWIISSIIPLGGMFVDGVYNPQNYACYNSGFTDEKKTMHTIKDDFSKVVSIVKLTVMDLFKDEYLSN